MALDPQFVVCTRNDNWRASLEVGKSYRLLNDERVAKFRLLRVIDESGEDYLYPEEYFARMEPPQA
jgi:hypothetical protein